MGKKRRAENWRQRRGDHIFKYPVAWSIHSPLGKMFAEGNTETLLEFKELLPETRPKQAERGREGEPGEGSMVGSFKDLLNIDFFLE